MSVKTILATKGKDVVTVHPDQTVKEAVVLLGKHNIGAVVVVEAENRIVGILSERDVVHWAARRDDVFTLKVSELMTTRVIVGMPQDDLHAIANLMTENRVRHIPIVDQHKLIGIVSIGDVVKAQRDQFKGKVDTLETQIMADQE